MTYYYYPFGLTRSDFPIVSPELRRALVVDFTLCPECGDWLQLSTNKCSQCTFDATPYRQPTPVARGPSVITTVLFFAAFVGYVEGFEYDSLSLVSFCAGYMITWLILYWRTL